jgi:glutathione peroxidase-family protein/uncharacterized membrane protein
MRSSIETSLPQKIARILLGAFMVAAAIGHFTIQRQEFQAQVPDWIPLSKDLVVILSGLVELILGLSMIFWKRKMVWVGIALASFYLLVLPGNIAQYINQTDAFGLNTDSARLIRLFFQPVLMLWALWSTGAIKALRQRNKSVPAIATNFYDLEAKDIRGNVVSMNAFRGKTILIVNTATKCGLAPQFEGLELLYQKYNDQNFLVLGFPSNQFAHQEPGDDATVAQSCAINFGVTFPLFSKIDVNGTETHPLFQFLKNELGGFLSDDIKWNFTKFLIDKNGNPIKRFAPTTKPDQIESHIQKII